MVHQSILSLLALPALALCAPHARHASQHAPAHVARSWSAPATSSGQVTFKNSCNYSVSVEEFAGPGCESNDAAKVAAGSSWNGTLAKCSTGNSVLKVAKEGSSTPMQFEYGVDSSNVWYDISFIDCVKSGYDFSACAGTSWAMASEPKCTTFSCSGGEECCAQGYCDPYATGQAQQPVAGCGSNQGYTDTSSLGVVIELCA